MPRASSRLGTALRLIGLGGCLAFQLARSLRILAGHPRDVLREAGLFDLAALLAPPTTQLAWLVVIVAFLLFGGLYWWTALGIEAPRGQPCTRAQLYALVLVASFLCPDGVFLVAALAAALFPPRAAFAWLAIQMGVVCFLLVTAYSMGLGVGVVEEPSLPAALIPVVDMIDLSLWQVFAFAVGYVCSHEARQRRELAQSNAELLATRQLLTEGSRVAERARVSTTIDERIGSRLGSLATILELASRTVEGKARAGVLEARDLVRAVLDEVRHVARTLGAPRPLELAQSLHLLTDGSTRPCVHLELPDDLRFAEPQRAHTLFRCAQEAVTNAVKHSGASNLWLRITRDAGTTTLQARDDGRGAPTAVFGNGLTGMRERVEALAGRIEIATSTGRGFCLRVVLPDG